MTHLGSRILEWLLGPVGGGRLLQEHLCMWWGEAEGAAVLPSGGLRGDRVGVPGGRGAGRAPEVGLGLDRPSREVNLRPGPPTLLPLL